MFRNYPHEKVQVNMGAAILLLHLPKTSEYIFIRKPLRSVLERKYKAEHRLLITEKSQVLETFVSNSFIKVPPTEVGARCDKCELQHQQLGQRRGSAHHCGGEDPCGSGGGQGLQEVSWRS